LPASEGACSMKPEEQIHKAVISHLAARSEPGAFWWHTPNGGKRHVAEAVKFKALGVVAGVPDILILKGGRLYALELKAPGGRLSPAQRLVGPRMEDCGAIISVAKSIDEALVTLEYWGILKRSVASASSPTAGE
jgi:hypothetical protein